MYHIYRKKTQKKQDYYLLNYRHTGVTGVFVLLCHRERMRGDDKGGLA